MSSPDEVVTGTTADAVHDTDTPRPAEPLAGHQDEVDRSVDEALSRVTEDFPGHQH